MKTRFFSILLAGLIVLVSHSPAAASVEYNLTISFVDDYDSCTGERVEVTGTQHIIGRSHTDGTGRQHFGFTRHTQGTGIGSESGANYLLIDSVSRSQLDGIQRGRHSGISWSDSRPCSSGRVKLLPVTTAWRISSRVTRSPRTVN